MPSRKNVASSVSKGRTGSLTAKVDPLSVLNAIAAEASRTTDLSDLLGLAIEQVLSLTEMEGGPALLVAEDAPHGGHRLRAQDSSNQPASG